MEVKPENSAYYGSGKTWTLPSADPIESPQRSSASGTQYYMLNDERTIEKRSYQVGGVVAGDTNDDSRYAEWQHVNGAIVPTRAGVGVPSELFNAYAITLDADRASSAATNHALQLGATDLEYEGTRVKSPVLGRDMNPMGRGDGVYYAQGLIAVRGAKPGFVNRCGVHGFGNSVNNQLDDAASPPTEEKCYGIDAGDVGNCCCGWVDCWTCLLLTNSPKEGCTPEICDWGIQMLYKCYMEYCCDCVAACCLTDGGWPECGFVAGCGYSSESMAAAPCHGCNGDDDEDDCACAALWPFQGAQYDWVAEKCAEGFGINLREGPPPGYPEHFYLHDCKNLCQCRYALSLKGLSKLDPTIISGIVWCLKDDGSQRQIASCILKVLIAKLGRIEGWLKAWAIAAKYLEVKQDCLCQAKAIRVCNQQYFGAPSHDPCCLGPANSMGEGLWAHCTIIDGKKKADERCWSGSGFTGEAGCEDFVERGR